MERLGQSSKKERAPIPSLNNTEFQALDPEKKEELITATVSEITEACLAQGARLYENVADMYRALGTQKLIVRREDPEKLLHTLETQEPLTISFPEGERYSNSVEWNPSLHGAHGIGNAYFEGYGQKNNVITVFGFIPSDALDIQTLPDASRKSGSLSRELVRSTEGAVDPKSIAFVSIRVPGKYFPESLLTEDEKELIFENEQQKASGMRTDPILIHRGFLFAKTTH